MTVLLVVLGAAVGAPLRYVVDRAISARRRTAFPLGTFAVNVVACAVLGVVAGAAEVGAASADVRALVATGFCGALSTYSTFSFETLRLVETGERRAAGANVVLSVAIGLLAVWAGVTLGHAVWG